MEVISREIVRQWSQVHENRLKKWKCSYLDQSMGDLYIPLLFLYQPDESKGLTTSNHVQISHQLKRSLPHAPTSFYPLAGRAEADDDYVLVVDCNDAGVEFVDARAHARLADVLGHPDMEEKLRAYVPVDHFAWIKRRRTNSSSSDGMVKFKTKRLVFDKEKIAILKKEAVSSPDAAVKDPTKTEAISAFIWKHVIEATKLKNPNLPRTYVASHAVNIRRKTVEPRLENVLGNCFMNAVATTDMDSKKEVGVDDLIRPLRCSIRKIDSDYIRGLQNGDTSLKELCRISDVHTKGGGDGYCLFSSVVGYPVNELVDYGFGAPIQFCPIVQVKNSVCLISTKDGEGVEAWVVFEPDELEMLRNRINAISNPGPS